MLVVIAHPRVFCSILSPLSEVSRAQTWILRPSPSFGWGSGRGGDAGLASAGFCCPMHLEIMMKNYIFHSIK